MQVKTCGNKFKFQEKEKNATRKRLKRHFKGKLPSKGANHCPSAILGANTR